MRLFFTKESIPGVTGVSKNQKLSTKYDFCSFEVNLVEIDF